MQNIETGEGASEQPGLHCAVAQPRQTHTVAAYWIGCGVLSWFVCERAAQDERLAWVAPSRELANERPLVRGAPPSLLLCRTRPALCGTALNLCILCARTYLHSSNSGDSSDSLKIMTAFRRKTFVASAQVNERQEVLGTGQWTRSQTVLATGAWSVVIVVRRCCKDNELGGSDISAPSLPGAGGHSLAGPVTFATVAARTTATVAADSFTRPSSEHRVSSMVMVMRQPVSRKEDCHCPSQPIYHPAERIVNNPQLP